MRWSLGASNHRNMYIKINHLYNLAYFVTSSCEIFWYYNQFDRMKYRLDKRETGVVSYLKVFVHTILGSFPSQTRLLHSPEWSHLQLKDASKQIYGSNLENVVLLFLVLPLLIWVLHSPLQVRIQVLQRHAMIVGHCLWIYKQQVLHTHITHFLYHVSPRLDI